MSGRAEIWGSGARCRADPRAPGEKVGTGFSQNRRDHKKVRSLGDATLSPDDLGQGRAKWPRKNARNQSFFIRQDVGRRQACYRAPSPDSTTLTVWVKMTKSKNRPPFFA